LRGPSSDSKGGTTNSSHKGIGDNVRDVARERARQAGLDGVGSHCLGCPGGSDHLRACAKVTHVPRIVVVPTGAVAGDQGGAGGNGLSNGQSERRGGGLDNGPGRRGNVHTSNTIRQRRTGKDTST